MGILLSNVVCSILYTECVIKRLFRDIYIFIYYNELIWISIFSWILFKRFNYWILIFNYYWDNINCIIYIWNNINNNRFYDNIIDLIIILSNWKRIISIYIFFNLIIYCIYVYLFITHSVINSVIKYIYILLYLQCCQ